MEYEELYETQITNKHTVYFSYSQLI